MCVSLMKNGYSQCVICHYYGDAFLYNAIFVAECEFTSIRDDILSTPNPTLAKLRSGCGAKMDLSLLTLSLTLTPCVVQKP